VISYRLEDGIRFSVGADSVINNIQNGSGPIEPPEMDLDPSNLLNCVPVAHFEGSDRPRREVDHLTVSSDQK
jgi:hypothetical protein